MENYYGLIELVFVFGLLFAFMGWQFLDLRRARREREEREARERKVSGPDA